MDVGDLMPITEPYYKKGLCPVNVHWHLGAEHYSAGEFDCTENMHDDERRLAQKCGPSDIHERRLAAGKERQGFQCNYYDETDSCRFQQVMAGNRLRTSESCLRTAKSALSSLPQPSPRSVQAPSLSTNTVRFCCGSNLLDPGLEPK